VIPAQDALEQLKQGNYRFVDGTMLGAGRDVKRARELAGAQQPFAVVLTCADSRVVPEFIFDTGIGDLFVVRVGGNIANPSTIASIEFAVAMVGVKLVVVMAHQNCGAVISAVERVKASPNLDHLIAHIQPAIDISADADVDTVIRNNCTINADRVLAESALLRRAIERDGVQLVTAYFSFETGEVAFEA
jgi:carbonic anhydrase